MAKDASPIAWIAVDDSLACHAQPGGVDHVVGNRIFVHAVPTTIRAGHRVMLEKTDVAKLGAFPDGSNVRVSTRRVGVDDRAF